MKNKNRIKLGEMKRKSLTESRVDEAAADSTTASAGGGPPAVGGGRAAARRWGPPRQCQCVRVCWWVRVAVRHPTPPSPRRAAPTVRSRPNPIVRPRPPASRGEGGPINGPRETKAHLAVPGRI